MYLFVGGRSIMNVNLMPKRKEKDRKLLRTQGQCDNPDQANISTCFQK